MTYLSFYRLVKSIKRQIIYRLTEILSFYAFLRPAKTHYCIYLSNIYILFQQLF